MSDTTTGKAQAQQAAFNQCAPLPRLTRDELAARMQAAGATRLIVAEFRINDSDSMSDYWGHSLGRTVAIGFGHGKRESFPQLRKAAAAFPPTVDYGPRRNDYTARVVLAEDVRGTDSPCYAGSYSRWHDDIGSGRKFLTREAAESFIADAGEPAPIHFFDDTIGRFQWQINEDPFEHRENYSMGGGNYLGRCRHSGWIVRSTTYLPESVEYWKPTETTRVNDKPDRVQRQKAASVATELSIPDLYAANV